MKKWLFRIIWFPVFIVAVLFLFANRRPVAISLDPFAATDPAFATVALPLWFWLMAMLFLGVAMGSVGMWLSGAERRDKMRADRRELKSLRREVTELRNLQDQAARRDGGDLPVLKAAS